VAEHIWKRGNQYWLRLTVPSDVQRFFLGPSGKPQVRIAEPLGDSLSEAKDEAAYRLALYTGVFKQIRVGLLTTPEQVKDAMRGYSEPDIAHDPDFGALHDLRAKQTRERDRFLAKLGVPLELRAKVDRALLRALQPETPRTVERQARAFEAYGASGEQPATRPAPTGGETISQARTAWIKEMTRDESAAPRQSTVEGHRQRVQVFVDKCGDLPLAQVTRAAAADFLASLNISNRTRNIYATTLKCVFESARKRGRFTGENPFAGQRSKVAKNHKVRYTVDELQMLFDKLPRDVAPKKHTPESAMPWVALIAAYSGACLEEICQLTLDDIREESVNGGRLWCIDIHNGDDEHKLKNENARPRLLPMHSALVRAGLLDYVANLPNKRGQLFPGLQRRASKDNKFGPRVGELYNKKLRKLGIKRKGLDFHSFRHTVSNVLEIAGVPQTDAARVLGHSIEGMTYGNYSQPGPGLIRVKDVVEKIKYEGLRL
jgi:integrase